MKIAIVVGHNARARGAVRVTDDKRSEYDWNGELAECMAQAWPSEVRVFRREATGRGYGAEIEAVYDQVNAWGADVSAELHFNAATAPSASGTETWYATDAGRAVAARVNAALVGVLGLPNRGIKRAGKGMAPGIDGTRGYESLICGCCPAVLVETYFGSNAKDCQRADAVREGLAAALYGALGGAPTATPRTPGLGTPPPPTPGPRTVEQRMALLETTVEHRLVLLEARIALLENG
jgi:N-acetylmuramoyl-L-alanine amidase